MSARLLVIMCTTCLAHAAIAAPAAPAATRPASTELTVQGNRFLVNGTTTFLYGISYYGGLGAPEEFVRRDLADMKTYGINWVRVWVTWSSGGQDVSAVDADGNVREPYWTKLKSLVAECDRAGVAVDLTISRNNLHSFQAHQRAVEALVTALQPHRNWYLDLANERDVRDARFVSFDELKQLRAAVGRLDGGRLVTASAGSDIRPEDLREYLQTVRVDFVCPHRPRDAGSPAQTEAKSRQYLAWMTELGRVVPLLYQEPMRRDYGKWQPMADDLVTDARGALAGGAAGWCLHNGAPKGPAGGRPGRSFDLRERRLFEQLDPEELKAAERVGELVRQP
jgi:hypothetical protein